VCCDALCAEVVNLWVWLPFRFVSFLDLLVPVRC